MNTFFNIKINNIQLFPHESPLSKANLYTSTGLIFFLVMSLLTLTGCKKLVEVEPPPGSLSENNVFNENTTAIAALNGIYTNMASGTGVFNGVNSISFLSGLSADEFTLFGGITTDKLNAYYKNALSAVNPPISGSEMWAPLYDLIYECNAAVKGLTHPSAAALTPAVRQQLTGEARFLRGFYYFYLVNLYGDVPIVTSTDPQTNIVLKRSPAAEVYAFIIEDLKGAKELLSATYLNNSLTGNTTERVRATRWAAAALLARVYLYTGANSQAEAEASEVIAQTTLYDTVSLNKVFLKNSKEAIWQLQPVDQFFNTRDAWLFVLTASGPGTNQPSYLSPQLKTAFEIGDNRYKPGNWINYRVINKDTLNHPFKYKLFAQDTSIKPATGTQNMGEYVMVLRLGEQYLIRAEARILQNRIAEGINDLNIIRTRARGPLPGDLPPLSTQLSLEEAKTAVLHERQTELFSEWGHRWFDLKRTGNIDAVMTIVTPLKSQGTIPWRSYQQLYPILQNDINKTPNLTQNTGYN